MGSCCNSKVRDPVHSKVSVLIPPSPKRNSDKKKTPPTDRLMRPTSSKSVQDSTFIKSVLHCHFLFSRLTLEDLEQIVESMSEISIAPKDTVFSQGETGNNFYIVKQGKMELLINKKRKRILGVGEAFGELALLHDSKRTATIRAVSESSLWQIDRSSFRSAIKSITESAYAENKHFIDNVPLFALLSSSQREGLLSLLVTQEFSDGQKIVVEGDPGDIFYIIKSGKVRCVTKGLEVRRLKKGDFFGEQALLYNSVRTASVIAVGSVTVLSLGREQLDSVLGNQLQPIMYKNSLKISIEKNPILNIFDTSQIETITAKIDIQSFKTGDVVIHKDVPKGKFLWIVLKGSLDHLDSKISVFDCIGDSDLFFVTDLEFADDFRAKEDSNVAVNSKEEIEEALGDSLRSIASKYEVIKVLKSMNLFRTLPMSIIKKAADALTIEEYAPNQVVFSEDEPGDALYIVKSGLVHIEVDGNFIRTIGKNDFFGERSIILNENRTATVTAKDHTTLWVISRNNFLKLLKDRTRNYLFKRMQLQDDKVSLSELESVKLLGKGMFGTVILTYRKSKDFYYALKTVMRLKVHAYDISENLILEREILLQMDHPMIMKLVKTFKDVKRLYFLMEYVRGMDLFDVIRRLNLLSIADCKFYMGCLLLIIEHLHERNIVYRDFKPENIMIDDCGYPKLIDFGCSKVLTNRTYTVVGTPHYMAPEIIVGKGYGLAVDLWSVGIILYEFISGCVPFGDDEEDPYNIYEEILEKNLEYPTYVSKKNKAKPLIEQLLSKTPAFRGNHSNLKSHEWFYNLNWEKLLAKQIKPPFVPDDLEEELTVSGKALMDIIDAEEIKDFAEIPDFSHKPPPKGWDEEF